MQFATCGWSFPGRVDSPPRRKNRLEAATGRGLMLGKLASRPRRIVASALSPTCCSRPFRSSAVAWSAPLHRAMPAPRDQYRLAGLDRVSIGDEVGAGASGARARGKLSRPRLRRDRAHERRGECRARREVRHRRRQAGAAAAEWGARRALMARRKTSMWSRLLCEPKAILRMPWSLMRCPPATACRRDRGTAPARRARCPRRARRCEWWRRPAPTALRAPDVAAPPSTPACRARP